jgi:hypothetical protein
MNFKLKKHRVNYNKTHLKEIISKNYDKLKQKKFITYEHYITTFSMEQ